MELCVCELNLLALTFLINMSASLREVTRSFTEEAFKKRDENCRNYFFELLSCKRMISLRCQTLLQIWVPEKTIILLSSTLEERLLKQDRQVIVLLLQISAGFGEEENTKRKGMTKWLLPWTGIVSWKLGERDKQLKQIPCSPKGRVVESQ